MSRNVSDSNIKVTLFRIFYFRDLISKSNFNLLMGIDMKHNKIVCYILMISCNAAFFVLNSKNKMILNNQVW